MRGERKTLSLLLVFACLLNLLLPFPEVRADTDPLLALEVSDKQTEFLSGEAITFTIHYNLTSVMHERERVIEVQLPKGLEYADQVVTNDHIKWYEYDAEKHSLIFSLQDGGGSGGSNAKGRFQFNSRFPNYKTANGTEVQVQGLFKVNGETRGASAPLKVRAKASSDWELSKLVLGDPYIGEEEVTYEMAFKHNPVHGELGRLDLQEVTFTDQLPPGAVFVRATFGGKYDPSTHMVTWENPGGITEGHANFNPDNPRRFTVVVKYPQATEVTKVISQASAHYIPLGETQATTVDTQVLHGFTEKLENPRIGEGIALVGSVSNEEPLSGEYFSYYIDYNLSGLSGTLTQDELVVHLPPELEFQPPHVQLTSHFKHYYYDREKHRIVFLLQDNLEASTRGQLRINNLRFPNYMTPNGTEAVISSRLNSLADVGDSAVVTVKAQASAEWEVTKQKIRPIAEPKPGTDVVYELIFHNLKGIGNEKGSLHVQGVSIVDQLPRGAVYVSSYPEGVYDPHEQTITWSLGDILAGDTYHSFRVVVNYPGASAGTTVTNTIRAEYTPLASQTVHLQNEVTHGFTNLTQDDGTGEAFYKYVHASDQEISPGQMVYFSIGGIDNKTNVSLQHVEFIDLSPEGMILKWIRLPKFLGLKQYDIYIATANYPLQWVKWQTVPALVSEQNQWLAVPEHIQGLVDHVQGVRIVGDIATSFDMLGDFVFGYKLADDYQVPIAEDKPYATLSNIASVSYKLAGQEQHYAAQADVHVVNNRPLLKVELRTNNRYFQAEDLVTYTITVENHLRGSDQFRNPIVEDLLPAELTYVPGSWKLVNRPEGFSNPKFHLLKNYQNTGREQLIWSWDADQPATLAIQERFAIQFQARINSETHKQKVENKVKVRSTKHAYLNDALFKAQSRDEQGWYIFATTEIEID